MSTSPLAGHLLPADLLVDLPKLIDAYYTNKPDAGIPEQRV
ncbi:MAG: alpha-D-glucose phosphate-specific phosphoglucomutase, partial [Cellvibrio sp.]|nr:alpha-D-glucose phosphate-specific phosphoglucomutase [Cellvibrio sp.]